MLSLNGLIFEEGPTSAKRLLISNAAGLIQHALTSKFASKDILLWSRGKLDPGERGVVSGELREVEGGEAEVRVYYMREAFIINKIE